MLCLVSHRATADSSFKMESTHLEWFAQTVLAVGKNKCCLYFGVTQKDSLTSHIETEFEYITTWVLRSISCQLAISNTE